MPNSHEIFITCARGTEDLLLRECNEQGLSDAVQQHGGVSFTGELSQAYRMCLWSRVGSRVLCRVHHGAVEDTDGLYRLASQPDWSEHIAEGSSLAIDCNTAHEQVNNSQFAVQRIKDAIVDQLRDRYEERPSVDRQTPDVRLNAYIDKRSCTLYIDLSGEPLHMRGYGRSGAVAPLRETLAAAMLYRCKWPSLAAQQAPLVDIMCGSGTILIEAASMALNRAPGLLRERFGFLGWKQHDEDAWQTVLTEARAATAPVDQLPVIKGFERSHRVLNEAHSNIEAAGFAEAIELTQSDSLNQTLSLPDAHGLMLTNPPYGKRLGDIEALKQDYRSLGDCLREYFAGWQAALITSEEELAQCAGLRAHHRNTLYNGPLRCTLYQYRMRETRSEASLRKERGELHDNAKMLLNRLRKNDKHLRRWAKQKEVSCYRLYDADLPQYAVAIDYYAGEFVVQEYQAPKNIPAGKARQHLDDVLQVIEQLYELPRERIILKTRKKQQGTAQYEQLDRSSRSRTVSEAGLRFEINLHDYLDTGLFLDHRQTRGMVRDMAEGKKVLNLFAYTGSFSVYAAAGGADQVTTVDMSNTYIDWARRNFELNDIDPRCHTFVRADCLAWMEQVGSRYDLIVLDPPTFSNSSKMETTLDINRDHVGLIRSAVGLLAEDGVLVFSCNSKSFRLDTDSMPELDCRDITAKTTPEDFRRRPLHQCWLISRVSDSV